MKTKFDSFVEFPDIPYLESIDDMVAVGGQLNTENLIRAYCRGIFPWPQEGYPMLWFFPNQRGVLDFDELHIPRSLNKFIRQSKDQYRFTVDQAFQQVMDNCEIQKRPNQEGTWIIPEVKKAYLQFHQDGYAHSIECWRGTQLVGGIYGVLLKGVFSAESMFHNESNTSKLSLLYLVDWLKNKNLEWMDIQMITPVTESFGGKYISGVDFFKRLPFSKTI